MQVIKKEKIVAHPLETIFDIEENTTTVEYNEVVPAEVVDAVGYDEKDNEIEEKLEEIYSIAMVNATIATDEMERVEGKFKASVGAVSAQMLNVALGATREKSLLKQHKDKLGSTARTAGTPHTLNQNLIVADRNEILRMMMTEKK
jgi:hypothetical protein